jgi:hypothetical protein
MSDMAYYEVLELYSESLKKASDRCKELGKLTDNKSWAQVAQSLTHLRLKGEKMATSYSVRKDEVEAGLQKHSELWATPSGN